jgi:hypothetical protein
MFRQDQILDSLSTKTDQHLNKYKVVDTINLILLIQIKITKI